VHPRVFEEFDRICAERRAGGDVLEIGAVPDSSSLLALPALAAAKSRTGLNLDGPHETLGFRILRGNANAMTAFADASFDTVLSNATLEHDPFFWKTLAEIRRVARVGALVVLGTPGYAESPAEAEVRAALPDNPYASATLDFLANATPTFRVHGAPSDYYRFSVQAYRDVFFEGMRDVEVRVIMNPPRIIGAGRLP
jgi:SAM-dependent methyltransferase